jgi:RHS repeat-associated protein
VLFTGDGKRIILPRLEHDGEESTSGGWAVRRIDGGYSVRPGNEFIHWFQRQSPDSERFDLVAISYRRRGSIEFEYKTPGVLAKVRDSAGREIIFTSDKGRTTSIHVPAPDGTSITFARYTYDEHGDLVHFVDADGNATRYSYDQHRLVAIAYPSGLFARFRYDSQGRCVETWCDRDGQSEPALADDAPELLADGQTKARGIYHALIDFSADGSSEVTDSRGIRRFEASPDGKVGKAVDARGGVMTRQTSPTGHLLSQTDANGAVSTFDYDEFGERIFEGDPTSGSIKMRRDAGGRIVQYVDGAGGTVTFTRDDAGEVLSVTDQNGAVTRFTNDARGLPVAVHDDRGGQTRYEYDQHGNAVELLTPLGSVVRFRFDWWGRCTSEQDPTGAVRRYEYTASGRVSAILDPLGGVTSFGYDGMGNKTSHRRPDGTTTTVAYGGLNWAYCTSYPDGSEVRVTFDREGAPIHVWNERGERFDLIRDATGLIIEERDFTGRVTRMKRDKVGHIVKVSEGRLHRTLTRDALGRVIAEENQDGEQHSFEYDARGELVAAKSGPTGFQWTRDATGEILREELLIRGLRYEVNKQRTRTGEVASLETSLGHQVCYTRNAMGQTVRIDSAGNTVLGIQRDSRGAPVERHFDAGGAMVSQFDPLKRLAARELVAAGTKQDNSLPEPLRRSGTRRYAFEYTPIDEVKSVWRPDGSSVEYTYDTRRHVTSVRSGGAILAAFPADSTGRYAEEGVGGGRLYEAGGKLVERGKLRYKYDDYGRLIERCSVQDDGQCVDLTRFEWNGWGNLAAVIAPDGVRTEFAYDAFARRLEKRVVSKKKVVAQSHFVWDLTAVVHEVEVKGEDCVAKHTFLFEDEQCVEPIAERRGSEWAYHVSDVNGAPLELVNGKGQPLAEFERGLFGHLQMKRGSAMTPIRFSGQWADAETGLHYNRYRYYDPNSGRYISPDPVGLYGGLELYAYGPNPVAWVDPMGWTHFLRVTGFDPAGARHSASGAGTRPVDYDSCLNANSCPRVLSHPSGHLGHSEQTFCHDLLRSGEEGGTYGLRGSLPPCPNCHGAMMRTAHETNSTITYRWGQPPNNNSITYTPTGVPPGNYRGSSARALRDGGYGATELTDGWTRPASGAAPARSGRDTWGVSRPPGTFRTYWDNK